MKIFDLYDNPKYWDNKATELLNQNPAYPDKINRYLINRKIFIIEEIINKINPFSIIEMGCGVGSVLIPLAKKFPKKRFHGVDFSKENLNQLQKTTLDNVSSYLSDISETKLYPKSFDFLYSLDVLCHLKFDKILKAVNEFHRISKKQYYVFHGLEYCILPYFYFVFSRLRNKKLAIKLTLRFSKRAEKNILPLMRGFLDG